MTSLNEVVGVQGRMVTTARMMMHARKDARNLPVLQKVIAAAPAGFFYVKNRATWGAARLIGGNGGGWKQRG